MSLLFIILRLSLGFPQMQHKDVNRSCKDTMSGLWNPYTVISASGYTECHVHSRLREAESRSPPLSKNREVILTRGGNTTVWSAWGSGIKPCHGFGLVRG